jgi:hypothetical protein
MAAAPQMAMRLAIAGLQAWAPQGPIDPGRARLAGPHSTRRIHGSGDRAGLRAHDDALRAGDHPPGRAAAAVERAPRRLRRRHDPHLDHAVRAKARNLAREPWAALHVTQEDFWAYAVLEATVELTPAAADPHDAVTDMLVEHYRVLLGEHDDWTAFREQQVADGRILALLRPTRAYGMLPVS